MTDTKHDERLWARSGLDIGGPPDVCPDCGHPWHEHGAQCDLRCGLVNTPYELWPAEPSVTKRFQRLLVAAGLPRVTFHTLRHSFASIALANGVLMRQIADTLGHATPTVTANIYSHLGTDAGLDVARRMEEALG